MPSPHDLQHCAGLPCVQHALARPDSQSLCCTRVYFLCDILWLEVQSHSDNSHMPTTGPHSAHVLTQARPTVSCIHLVYMQTCVEFLVMFVFKMLTESFSILSSSGSPQG